MKQIVVMMMLGMMPIGCGVTVAPETVEQIAERSEMMASLTETAPLLWQYEVKNVRDQEVTLEFTSSQRFDYSIENEAGEEVFLFSSVTSFLQVLGEENLKPGEVLTYKIDVRDLNLDPGNYTMTAWMTPKEGAAFIAKKSFTVPVL